jgi:hypothetical protein
MFCCAIIRRKLQQFAFAFRPLAALWRDAGVAQLLFSQCHIVADSMRGIIAHDSA